VGLIAGWLAGQAYGGGSGYGVLVDIIPGIVGGVGRLGLPAPGIWPGDGMIGSIVVALVGAVILVWITRLLKKA
jgi:uncharacterized membrane protein YeaQ/YmgE (transglycosylase-associated protein family)